MPRGLIGIRADLVSRIVAKPMERVQFALMTTPAVPTKPTIAVSMGDPAGIGPEVLVKALAETGLRRSARFIVHGLSEPLLSAAERAGIHPFWWRVRAGSPLLETASGHDVVLVDHTELAQELGYRDSGRPQASRASGALSFRFVDDAIAASLGRIEGHPRADAIVTAPISKHAWALAGYSRWPGHTELLAERFNAARSRMMFVAPKLRVILVTAHVPLGEVGSGLTIGRVFDTIDLGHEACLALGIRRPRIAVAGLNPHAGEEGLLGDDEKRIISPAIAHAQRNGIVVEGPLPGDTVFNAALKGRFDLVVAMYHDQGLIPVKLLAFDSAVNVTTGLPVWRTSPDHGTAYDIAGQNRADCGSMKESLRLAVRLATSTASAS